MAGSKNVKATDDAAEAVKSVRSYDHAAPSAGEMATASGVDVGPASMYVRDLGQVGTNLERTFQDLLKEVHLDCERSQQSIEQMQGMDEEIALLLKGLVPESGAETKPGGASTGSEDVQW